MACKINHLPRMNAAEVAALIRVLLLQKEETV